MTENPMGANGNRLPTMDDLQAAAAKALAAQLPGLSGHVAKVAALPPMSERARRALASLSAAVDESRDVPVELELALTLDDVAAMLASAVGSALGDQAEHHPGRSWARCEFGVLVYALCDLYRQAWDR